MTADAHVLYRRIFLERRPSADVSWGGHRIGYIFYTEGKSILYYDVAIDVLVERHSQRSGTLTLEREPIMCQNMVYLPIPSGFESFFVPTHKPIRLTVHHQILGVESSPILEKKLSP